ncbi:MAG: energy transducer TonB [Flavitalea sp.]
MNSQQLLSAEILDIIFEGRNKEYGAYELRKHYNRRMIYAISGMMLFIGLLLAGYFVSGKSNGKTNIQPITTIIDLIDIPTIEPEKPLPVPPPPPTPPQEVNTRQYTTPIIVDKVPEDERPPEMDELDNAVISTRNIYSDVISDIVAPPIEAVGNGIIEAPPVPENENKVWEKVEIESEFPGGLASWKRFLIKTLNYPEDAIEEEVSGTVVVQFIVDQEGNVSEVEAISGPDLLKAEAIRVIKKSGKWTAAIQNGRKVKSYKKQPMTFRLD